MRLFKRGGQAASPRAGDPLLPWENLHSEDSGLRTFQRSWSLNAEVGEHLNGVILRVLCLSHVCRELRGTNLGVSISPQALLSYARDVCTLQIRSDETAPSYNVSVSLISFLKEHEIMAGLTTGDAPEGRRCGIPSAAPGRTGTAAVRRAGCADAAGSLPLRPHPAARPSS